MNIRWSGVVVLAFTIVGGSVASPISPLSRTTASVLPPSTAGIRMLGIGGNAGNQAADVVFSSGDLPGTSDRSLSTAQFNAMTPAQLRASYDVILFTWQGDPSLNADWATRILPFLALGGGVLFEDNDNAGDLAPAVIASGFGGSGGYAFTTAVPGLTTGVNADFVNHHFELSSWQAGLNLFITSSGTPIAVYGEFGDGRILVTGNDQDYHSSRGAGGTQGNQYNFLVNELRWVGTPAKFVKLRSDLASLVTGGSLPAAYGSMLTQVLNLAKSRYAQVQGPGSATLLRSFINYVQRSSLSAGNKTMLIDQANVLISLVLA
jgi:hypothetical protein